jgi:hypothetical protein
MRVLPQVRRICDSPCIAYFNCTQIGYVIELAIRSHTSSSVSRFALPLGCYPGSQETPGIRYKDIDF